LYLSTFIKVKSTKNISLFEKEKGYPTPKVDILFLTIASGSVEVRGLDLPILHIQKPLRSKGFSLYYPSFSILIL
jgi:hypothetical protein